MKVLRFLKAVPVPHQCSGTGTLILKKTFITGQISWKVRETAVPLSNRFFFSKSLTAVETRRTSLSKNLKIFPTTKYVPGTAWWEHS